MKEETLKKANELNDRLIKYKKSLKDVGYTQSENVVSRESYLEFNGIEGNVPIPATLFRIIGKLIESEYIGEISRIQNELDNL
jgi:hypothetical protein